MNWQSIGGVLVRARALIALCSLAILTACGGSSSPTTESELAFCDSTDFAKVLNAVPKTASAATSRKTALAVPAGTVRIHYHRSDATYTGWTTYVYNATPTGEALGGWPGAAATGTDSFGVYWDVPTTSAFNFIIYSASGREPSSWSKKSGTDEQQYWDIAGGTELWKLSGDSTNYSTNPLTATTADITTVRVHYKRYDSGYDSWGLHLWSDSTSGLDTASLPSGVTIGDWNNPVPLKAMTGYTTDSYGVTFDIPVQNPTTNASAPTQLQFIIHGLTNTGNKDGWTDNIKVPYAALTVANKIGEIWLIQEDASVYYAKPDTRSASTTDAKAYWLTKNLIQWPKVDGSGVFKLYSSATGQIVASKDAKVTGSDSSITLTAGGTVPADAATRFKYISAGVVLTVADADLTKLANLHTTQLVLVQEDSSGNVQNATTAQVAGAFDDLFSGAQAITDLGVKIASGNTTIKLWAPSAKQVKVCSYDTGTGKATSIDAATQDPTTGVWTLSKTTDLTGKYYTFVVDVFVRGVGLVRNRVTDPYSISLTTDSTRSYIADLSSSNLKPTGWDDATANPNPTLENQVDMSIYELHVRDFSANDSTVPAAHQGKYLAFTDTSSNGMQHLIALKNAGLTDVHLLPVFDIATVPESGCVTPSISGSTGDSTVAKDAITAVADKDCFNWGYDPYHYTAPEGSYATDASDGAVRIKEFRQMVMALHAQGLRVGMDVVYNHTHAAGQDEKSVLDRIVPGYYQRLSTSGSVTTDTCCSDTATENAMMAKLMIDSVSTWATQYKIDSFRFDLMGFQPASVMKQLKTAVNAAAGRDVFLIGEGWNYGVVANGARFVQASQLSLNGSGIGTFSDRARDRVRGGNYNQTRDQGFVTGYLYDPNDVASGQTLAGLQDESDIIRVALGGSIRSFSYLASDGSTKTGETTLYGSDPAGYVVQPQEVVNYYENHDNATMWDAIVAKMPKATSLDDRVRAQSLAAAINSFSQGIAYFHAGSDILRSKSLDSNSYNSGDWFNRLDWSYTANNFGVGMPINTDSTIASTFLAAAVYANYTPASTNIAQARDVFREFLGIRKSSSLFRMRSADDIKNRLSFYNADAGTGYKDAVVAAHISGVYNGVRYANSNFDNIVYVINADKYPHSVTMSAEKGKSYSLHTIQANGKDAVVKTSAYDSTTGKFTVPARTAAVFVAANPT